MGKGKSQTIGYHYLFDILFGLGRGPLDEVCQIKVGDKPAWIGSVTESGSDSINAPDLFGGEKKEGGIQGPFRVFMGEADQVLPGAGPTASLGKPTNSITLPDVKASIGGLVSEFRGVATFWFSGLVCSMNPYPKEWKFRVRRALKGWMNDDCWYPAKARVILNGTIYAMNGAHIIYECLTNKSWGRGLPTSFVDGGNNSTFVGAANTLCSELFGLCFLWQRKEDVDAFINVVLDHIGGMLYLDRETGKMCLRLIRGDYSLDDLPIFTPSSGLLDITEDDSSSQDTAFNEVIAIGHDPVTDNDIQVRVHNLAARQSQGASNADDKNYPGIPTKTLLLRAAQRDLRAHASGLKKFTVILDRRAYKLTPGMCFRIQDPRRGIADMVLRASIIIESEVKDGRITVKAMQDVYGMPDTSFVTPVDGSWEPPDTTALPAPDSRLIEAGYRDAIKAVGEDNVASLDETDAFVGMLAKAPNNTSLEYELLTKVSILPDYVNVMTGNFTGSATLVDDITELQTTFEVEDAYGISEDNIGEAVMIDDEEMLLVDFDLITNIATVTRGNADTIPQVHLAGAILWTLDDDLAVDPTEYVVGETIDAKVLTRTSSDLLDEGDAPVESVELIGRIARPYPPGNVEVDGTSIFEIDPFAYYDEPTFTWAHRDRVTQQDTMIPHGAASIGPEVGVTYNIRIYDYLDPLVAIRTEAAIAGDEWQYDDTMQTADGAPYLVYVELESERDSLVSWQKYRFLVALTPDLMVTEDGELMLTEDGELMLTEG